MTTLSAFRRLFSFGDKTQCTRVSVQGDATYCVKGPVCGELSEHDMKQKYGACPSKRDAAIEDCTPSSRTFSIGCVAPMDAQCVIRRPGQWACAYPDTHFDSSLAATKAHVMSVSEPSSTLALSASTQESGTSGTMGVSSVSINVAVVVACCVLAFVGLVLVKKRRNRERSSSYTLSEKDISIVTL